MRLNKGEKIGSILFQFFGDLLHALDGEGRIADGLHGDGHELDGIVIGGDAVGTHGAAPFTAVDQSPLPLVADPDSDRLHDTAAVSFAVTGFVVQMHGMEAVGTVIAMVAAGTHGYYFTTTVAAGKDFITGVGFVIALVVLFSLVFSIHDLTSYRAMAVDIGRFLSLRSHEFQRRPYAYRHHIL